MVFGEEWKERERGARDPVAGIPLTRERKKSVREHRCSGRMTATLALLPYTQSHLGSRGKSRDVETRQEERTRRRIVGRSDQAAATAAVACVCMRLCVCE